MSIVWLIAAAFLAGAVVSATVILRIAHALRDHRRGGTIDFTDFVDAHDRFNGATAGELRRARRQGSSAA